MKLLERLKSIGVDWRDQRLIERLYMKQRTKGKSKGERQLNPIPPGGRGGAFDV